MIATVACNASLTPIIESTAAEDQLDLLADAIQRAQSPAFFVIWQDAPDSKRLFDDALNEQANLNNLYYVEPKSLDADLTKLQQRSSSISDYDGVVFLGCLSPMQKAESQQFNAARDRLLQLSNKMIFAESIVDERKVRLNFPDIMSLVSQDCRLFQRHCEEDLFATSDASLQGDAADGAPIPLSGTVHEVRDVDAECWLEISPGVRVKFAVPLALLGHLNPQPGVELHWNPGQVGEAPTFNRREPTPPEPELVREVKERYQRIRKTLEDWQPHLPADESES